MRWSLLTALGWWVKGIMSGKYRNGGVNKVMQGGDLNLG